MPAAIMPILNGAAPSLIIVGSLAGQEALLNSQLNTVGLDGLFGVGFLTSLGAETDFCTTLNMLLKD